MSGKDLMAVLLMIVPAVVLIALIALTLVPPSVMQPFPGSGVLRSDVRQEPDRQPGAESGYAMRVVLVHTRSQMATQKKMRDPWARHSYAKAL